MALLGCTAGFSAGGEVPGDDASERFAAHSRLFADETVELSGKGVHVFLNAGGFASNIAVIEGPDGLVFIDSGVTSTHARIVLDRVRQFTHKRVAAIVYTHHHMDHTGGAGVLLDGQDAGRVRIIAAANFMREYTSENLTIAPVWSLRAVYQFGTVLRGAEARDYHLGCCGAFRNDGEASFVEPDTLIEDARELQIAGLRLRFFRMGGESPTALGVHLPDLGVAFVGDEMQGPTFPQLHAPRGSRFRDANRWIAGLDAVRALDIEALVPSHGRPFLGRAQIRDNLTAYRDAIQYTHDQAIRFINKGYDPDQLAAKLHALPGYLQTPITGEFYGTVASSVRSLYSGYISWFSGDAVDIAPLPERERARRMLVLMGGRARVLEQAQGALEGGEYQWAAELATLVIRADDDADARAMKARALRELGERQTSSTFRSWYFTSAMELEGDPAIDRAHAKWLGTLLSDRNLAQQPAAQLLDQLRFRVNADVARDTHLRIGFRFTDADEASSVELRHSIIEVSPGLEGDLDAMVTMPKALFVRMLRGETTFSQGIGNGTITVSGDHSRAEELFSCVDFTYPGIRLNGAK